MWLVIYRQISIDFRFIFPSWLVNWRSRTRNERFDSSSLIYHFILFYYHLWERSLSHFMFCEKWGGTCADMNRFRPSGKKSGRTKELAWRCIARWRTFVCRMPRCCSIQGDSFWGEKLSRVEHIAIKWIMFVHYPSLTWGAILAKCEYLWSPRMGVFSPKARWHLIWCFIPATTTMVIIAR